MRFPSGVPTTGAAALYATLALSLVGCGREGPPPRVDSAAPPPPVVRVDSAPTPAPAAQTSWDSASTGPALFVPTDTTRPTLASAVLPDVEAATTDSAAAASVAPLEGVTVDLFALGGKLGTARVAADERAAAAADPELCAPWPAVRLSAAPARGSWRVAFSAGHASPLPVDSIEGLSAADSASRAAEVARLASLVPRTKSRDFAGLPFSVRQARTFSAAGTDVLVAEAVRKIAQEANPREQHVLVVGERAAGSTAKYELAYSETSAGNEARVETRDVLAAVTLGANRRPTLVLNREYEDAFAYSLLERVGKRQWRVRWTSAKLGCDAA